MSSPSSSVDGLTEDLIATWVFASKLLRHNPTVRDSFLAALKAKKIAILLLVTTAQTLATGDGSVELQGGAACHCERVHDSNHGDHDQPFLLVNGKIITLTASSVLVCIVTPTNQQARQMPVQMFQPEAMDFALNTWLIPSSIPALYKLME